MLKIQPRTQGRSTTVGCRLLSLGVSSTKPVLAAIGRTLPASDRQPTAVPILPA